MKFRLFAVAALMTAVLCGCSTSAEKTKTLVLYYSQTGATKAVAEELQRQLGADIVCIEAVEHYDADYAATVARWRQERETGRTDGGRCSMSDHTVLPMRRCGLTPHRLPALLCVGCGSCRFSPVRLRSYQV